RVARRSRSSARVPARAGRRGGVRQPPPAARPHRVRSVVRQPPPPGLLHRPRRPRHHVSPGRPAACEHEPMSEPSPTRRAWDGDRPAGVVGFTAMADGTADDYALLDRYERLHAAGLADRVLAMLRGLSDSLDGYQVTRLEHSLQAATRARRDGADVDWVTAALLHDIGDGLAPYNHSELAAAVLQP